MPDSSAAAASNRRPLDLPPGIHAGVSFADYLALPGVSQTTLKRLARTPAHARHAMDAPPEPTEAQSLGTAAHCAVLEPGRFARDYFALPEGGIDRRTKAGKAAYEQALADNPGGEPLTHADHAACLAMAASLRSRSPWLARLFDECPGVNEAVLLWDEPAYGGLRCKARPDRIALIDDDTALVLDPKTTADASPGAFARDCAKYQYHVQAAFYLRGLDAIHGPATPPRRFVFVAMEKSPPYLCAAYELCPEALALGRSLVRQYLATYADCLASGRWPGYPPHPEAIDLPAYAYGRPDEVQTAAPDTQAAADYPAHLLTPLES